MLENQPRRLGGLGEGPGGLGEGPRCARETQGSAGGSTLFCWGEQSQQASEM